MYNLVKHNLEKIFMNFIFLSPHFPPNYKRFCLNLKQAGATVLGLGDTSYDLLDHDLKYSLTEYYRVSDLHQYDELLRACGYLTHRYGKIDRIDSLNEYWLETEARLRTDFNIAGIKNDTIHSIKYKSRMKEIFRQAGIPVARGQVLHTYAEAEKMIPEYTFPLVAKPDKGVGALSTFKINSLEELRSVFEKKAPVDYIFEEFVPGSIYTFDGLTNQHGRLIFYTSHTYSQGVMETVNDESDIYYYSLRDIPARLEDYGKKCIQAFDVRERFFHFEFFHTPDDQYVGLEVNIRPPGGFTTDMFNYAFDSDIYRAWAEMIVHGKTELPFERKFHCCYVSRKHGQRYKYSHDEIIRRFGYLMVMDSEVPHVFRTALGDYCYIFRTHNPEQLFEVAHLIQEK